MNSTLWKRFMKTKFKYLAVLVLLSETVIPAWGQGVVVVQHSGATDPITEDWSGVGGYPVTNDLGVNAWSTPNSDNLAALYEYALTPQQQAGLTAGWVFSVNARIVPFGTSGASPNNFNATLMGAAYGNVALWFGSMANGDPLINLVSGPGLAITNSFVLTGAGMSYNLYQLILNGPANMLSFWINGVEYASNISPPQNLSDVIWGGGGSPQYERVNWNLVSFETVPEPSDLSLLFLGSSALIYLRVRKRFWLCK